LKILIIGAGRVGRSLAAQLVRSGHSVTLIDKDETKMQALHDIDAEFLLKDATDPRTYEELDIKQYDVVVAVTDRDEVNLFVAAIASMYNIPRIYVRAKNPHTAKLVRVLGVDGVVVTPQIAANLLYSFIEGRYRPVNLVNTLIGEFHLVSVMVKETSQVRGLRPREIEAKGLIPRGVKILSIYHEGKFYDPEEAPPLDVGHVVIALVHREALERFRELF